MPQRSTATKRLNELLATSQNKSYFVGAITVVFIVIMSFVGILPAYSAFTFQNEENGKRDILIGKLNAKLKTSQTLSKDYDAKSKLVDYFKDAFPDNADQQNIINLINDIVLANDSYVSKITFNKNATPSFLQSGFEEQIKSQQVSISVEGSQSSLLSVVKDIESSRRILNISTLTLDRKSQDIIDQTELNIHGDYSLNVQLEYYFFTKSVTTN